MIKELEVDDKVKFVCADTDLDTQVPVGSVGILTMKDSDQNLNHFVTFSDFGVSEWFRKHELELVE
jgi:hypothetical protein